jgi:hypothetical protein
MHLRLLKSEARSVRGMIAARSQMAALPPFRLLECLKLARFETIKPKARTNGRFAT